MSFNLFKPIVRGAWFGPAVLALLFLVMLGALLGLTEYQAHENERAELIVAARNAQERLRLHLDGTRDYLSLLADEIERGAPSGEALQPRATRYVSDHPELISIAFAGPDFVVRWAAPAPLNRPVVGLELTMTAQRDASRQAMQTRRPVYTPGYVGINGGTVIDLFVPVFRQHQFLGTLVGTYSCEGLLRHCLQRDVLQKHHVQMVDADGNAVASTPLAETVDRRMVERVPIPPLRYDLRLTRYRLHFWSWGMAVLTMMCVGLVIGMAWSMWTLSRHIAQRRKAEEALREAHDYLELRVRQRTEELVDANQQLQRESTERQRAEGRARDLQEQLAHMARLTTMGEMAAGLAHEINQPLASIVSFS